MRRWAIRRALGDEAASAVRILRDVSTLLVTEGDPLWNPADFEVDDFRSAALRGELVLGYHGSDPVACMLLQRCDPVFWPDDAPGEALYLHKLAVLSHARGRGWSGRLIRWALARAVESDVRFLRLDAAPRSKLIGLYEDHGFVLIDLFPRWFGETLAMRLEMRI
jgi:ribosomal protein S18 acetylase RimI-like enzyme